MFTWKCTKYIIENWSCSQLSPARLNKRNIWQQTVFNCATHYKLNEPDNTINATVVNNWNRKLFFFSKNFKASAVYWSTPITFSLKRNYEKNLIIIHQAWWDNTNFVNIFQDTLYRVLTLELGHLYLIISFRVTRLIHNLLGSEFLLRSTLWYLFSCGSDAEY